MVADHVDPLQHAVLDAGNLDQLDDQSADGLWLGAAVLVVLFRLVGRGEQGKNGDRLGVRFVDVFLDGVFDLGWEIAAVAGVPHRVAAGHDRRGQTVEQHDGVGPFVKGVLAADRLDVAFPALADGDADPVAIDQPPAFVGDGEGRLVRIETGVDRAGKILQLRPHGLAIGEVPQAVRLEKVRSQLAHLQQEPQIPTLGTDGGVGTLKDLDQPSLLAVGPHGTHDQQIIGGVAPFVFVGRAAMGRHQRAFAAVDHAVQQPAVLLLGRLVARQVRRLEIDLMLEFQLAGVVDRPDGATHRGQCRDDPVEKLSVKLGRRRLGTGQLGDFSDESPNLASGLLDHLLVDRFCRLLSAHVVGAAHVTRNVKLSLPLTSITEGRD